MSDENQNDADVTFDPEDIPDAEWYFEPIPRSHAALAWTVAIGVTITSYLYGPDGAWMVMAGMLLMYPVVALTLALVSGAGQ